MAEYDVIDEVARVGEVARRLADGEGPVAVDVERASGFRYSQRAYLVQVYRRGAGVFLFDPPPIGDFRALEDAIGAEEWVLHAASQDWGSGRVDQSDAEWAFASVMPSVSSTTAPRPTRS